MIRWLPIAVLLLVGCGSPAVDVAKQGQRRPQAEVDADIADSMLKIATILEVQKRCPDLSRLRMGDDQPEISQRSPIMTIVQGWCRWPVGETESHYAQYKVSWKPTGKAPELMQFEIIQSDMGKIMSEYEDRPTSE